MNALIAATGSDGAQAFVQSNNNIYVYSGSGWYKIATVQNDSPSAITGVNGTYSLTTDGTPTVSTAVSTDPEGFPLTWSYSTSCLGSIAIVSQVDNVFTITPSTDNANFGTFTLTINATDGVNGAVSANTSISLQFQVLNSNHTTLLATATGTSDNNNITDSSSNNHSITVSGDTHAGTFSPYRSGGYSTYFDGTGDFLEGPAVDLLGSGAFTLECWAYIYSTTSGYTDAFLAQYQSNQKFIFGVKSDVLRVWMSGSEVLVGTTNIIGGWHHFALVRDSNNNCQVYIDGNAEGSSFSNSTDFSSSLENFEIGSWDNGANSSLDGYITDLRIVKGTAITPPSGGPTERLEAVTNTSLLTCHLPYIADGSTNGHSITINGSTSTKPFSPYDYSEYSASVNGGSIHFDGSGDYLTMTDDASIDLSTGDFTLEAWIYLESASGNRLIIDRYASGNNGSFQFYYRDTGNSIAFWTVADGIVAQDPSSSTIKANTWHHVVATRESGNVKLYVDGSQVASASCTTNFDSTLNLAVGAQISTSTNYLTGNIADVRIVKGTAVYTTDFTPPTAPLTAITNTSLLVSGTDASIIDKSQVNNLQLVGNTTGSTTQVKFTDTKSMYFDGAGDYIDTDIIAIDTDDFTLECWVYVTSNSANQVICDTRPTSTDNTTGFNVQYQTTNRFYVGSFNIGYISGSTSRSLNTWYHIAITRSGNTMTLWVNGQSDGTYSHSTNLTSTDLRIGTNRSAASVFNGYVQDFRITKGLARYTATFTPPAEPLKG